MGENMVQPGSTGLLLPTVSPSLYGTTGKETGANGTGFTFSSVLARFSCGTSVFSRIIACCALCFDTRAVRFLIGVSFRPRRHCLLSVTSNAAWTSKSLFADHDAKIVWRSAALLGYPADFRYKEVMGHKVRRRHQSCVGSMSQTPNSPRADRPSLEASLLLCASLFKPYWVRALDVACACPRFLLLP